MKVFGIGLARTGNLSLATALRVLGLHTVHFPQSDQDYETHDAATDSPVALAFRELDARYPSSRFILTMRDMGSWLRSMRWLFESARPIDSLQNPEREKIRALRMALYGTVSYDADVLAEAWRRHHAAVARHFEHRGELLVVDFTKGHGWREICRFLDMKIPEKPFPHFNRRR